MNEDQVTTIQNNDDFEDSYAEALDNVPYEVRRFMWSEAFDLIIRAITETYKLTESQSNVVKRVAMETLVGTLTPVSRQIKLSDAGITGDLQEKVLDAINEEIISRALTQMAIVDEEESQAKQEIKAETLSKFDQDHQTTSTPEANISPIEALAMVKDKLLSSNVVAPTKRDYSIEKPATVRDIDPYRELPNQ